jgi:hypothetical protein
MYVEATSSVYLCGAAVDTLHVATDYNYADAFLRCFVLCMYVGGRCSALGLFRTIITGNFKISVFVYGADRYGQMQAVSILMETVWFTEWGDRRQASKDV